MFYFQYLISELVIMRSRLIRREKRSGQPFLPLTVNKNTQQKNKSATRGSSGKPFFFSDSSKFLHKIANANLCSSNASLFSKKTTSFIEQQQRRVEDCPLHGRIPSKTVSNAEEKQQQLSNSTSSGFKLYQQLLLNCTSSSFQTVSL